MPIAQFPSGFSSFCFVFRVKNGAKSAHYSLFVYPVYQIYIGGPAAMQPPNAAVILPLYNCNTDLIWPFTAFRPGGTAGGRWHGSAGRSRTSASTAPWQRQRWSRRPCSAPHLVQLMYPSFLDFWCKSTSHLLYTLRIDNSAFVVYNKARNQRSTAEAQTRANPADFKQKGAKTDGRYGTRTVRTDCRGSLRCGCCNCDHISRCRTKTRRDKT